MVVSKIAVLGDIYCDIQTGPVAGLPDWNGDLKAEKIKVLLGGSSSNTARSLGAIGRETQLFTALGDDDLSDLLRKKFDEEKLVQTENSLVKIKSNFAPTAIVLFNNKNRCFVSNNGCLEIFSPDMVDEEQLFSAKHLHIGGYFICNGMQCPEFKTLLEKVKAKGITISMDCQFDPTNKWTGKDNNFFEILPLLDVFMPSEIEAKGIAKCSTISESLEILFKKTPKTLVIVKNGSNGAFYKLPGHQAEVFHVDAIKCDVVDTTGAGDAFDAGFVDSWTSSIENDRSKAFDPDVVQQAVKAGCKLGSMSTTKEGAFNLDIFQN